MQTLDVISINLWQMLVSLANLVLLFLIIKKLLYQPVKKMLADRQSTIDGDYSKASEAKSKAESDMLEYSARLAGAKKEAEDIIKVAVGTASDREKAILEDAKSKADGIIRKAEEDAALEFKRSEEVIKKQIADVSTAIAQKVMEREVTSEDHDRFVEDFIESIGENDAAE